MTPPLGRAQVEVTLTEGWEKIRQKVVLKQSTADQTAGPSLEQSRAQERNRDAPEGGRRTIMTLPLGRANVEVTPTEWWEKIRRKVVLKQSTAEQTAGPSLGQSRAQERSRDAPEGGRRAILTPLLAEHKSRLLQRNGGNRFARKWS